MFQFTIKIQETYYFGNLFGFSVLPVACNYQIISKYGDKI